MRRAVHLALEPLNARELKQLAKRCRESPDGYSVAYTPSGQQVLVHLAAVLAMSGAVKAASGKR